MTPTQSIRNHSNPGRVRETFDLGDGTRRRFIRNFVLGSAFSAVAGGDWMATLVAACDPVAPGAGILRVKISSFPTLANPNGSVRLLLNPATQNGPSGFFYPVIINRGQNDQFFALNSRCTHQGCVVPTFNGTASICPCHGSRYAIDGSIIFAFGGGAQPPLARYPTTYDGVDLLCVEIPSLGYSVIGSTVETGAGPRFSLSFPTRSQVRYEVRFRQNLADPGVMVPLSTTEAGPATSNFRTGTGGTVTVYVDRTTASGFYSVAVIVTTG
jgi:Rieske Fe-S protein